MLKKIQKKMYILCGSTNPCDHLDGFRYFTMQGLNTVPHGHIRRIHDEALEVDLTGMEVEFEKCDYDPYWTCNDTRHLKDAKVARVAFIDGKWKKLDADDPYENPSSWLEGEGYRRKLGYGSGWFSKDNCPSYKDLVFKYFDYKGRNHSPEWDIKTQKYAGIFGDHRHDEFKIYNGNNFICKEEIVGSIRVEGEMVVIKMHDDVYLFHDEKDDDFARWTRMCVEGYNDEFAKHPNDDDSMRYDSSNRMAVKMAKHLQEQPDKDAALEKILADRINFEIEIARKNFARYLAEYVAKKAKV